MLTLKHVVCFGFILTLAACGGDDAAAPIVPPVTPLFDFWIDATNGDDGAAGTESMPFKTLTHALSTAGPNTKIKVAPGTYDAALGETFPIIMKDGQALVGDVANKGDGATPILVDGLATYSHVMWQFATIIGAPGTRISGLKMGSSTYQLNHMTVFVDSFSMELSDNTFYAGVYGGISVMQGFSSVVRGNVFNGVDYGVFVWNCPDATVIEDNVFLSSFTPVDIGDPNSRVIVRNNTITGSGLIGISVQHGQPLISGNIFNSTSGYALGAIRCGFQPSQPIVRGNSFVCTTGIVVLDGTPDFGTATDPGNNDFSGIGGVSFTHQGPATIQAMGNTWPNTPPVPGVDIVVTGGGTVVW